jgi:uncharacterized membrane protein
MRIAYAHIGARTACAALDLPFSVDEDPMTPETSPEPGPAARLARGLGWFSIGLGLAELVATDATARLVGLPDRGGHRRVLRAFGARELASGLGILANPGSSGWVWSRVAGDAMDLLFLGRALDEKGADRPRLLAAMGAVAGVAALDAYCASRLGAHQETDKAPDRGIEVRETTTIAAPAEALYMFWRDLRNLPRFMEHLLAVEVVDERRSRWTAAAPAGVGAEWDAEIVEDRPYELIAWRSIGEAEVDNRGSVTFAPVSGGTATDVVVELRYAPPGGRLGRVVSKLMGDDPARQVRSDLRTLKRLLEAGELARSEAPG